MLGVVANSSPEGLEFLKELIAKRLNFALLPDRVTEAELEFMAESAGVSELLRSEKDFSLTKKVCESPAEGRIVFFTSGSTGEPKAVVHDLDRLRLAANASNLLTGLKETHSWLVPLPLSHVGGFSVILRTQAVGAKIHLLEGEDLSASIRKLKPSHISLVPTQLIQIIDDDLSCVETILLGGAPAAETLLEKAKKKGLKVINCYGMTEAGSTLATISPEGHLEPLNGVELKITAEGKLLVKSPGLFLGYLKASGQGFDNSKLKDDWFLTDDLAEINSTGEVKLEGRGDRTIISGGENIHPREIEIQVERISGIKEAAVISRKDNKWGERPVLFYSAQKALSEELILSELEKGLTKFKTPDSIYYLETLPRLATGKIDYLALESKLT